MSLCFFYMLQLQPISTLFPYTTLFRSFSVISSTNGELGLIGGRTYDYYGHLSQGFMAGKLGLDRKSTRLNSSHEWISYAVVCLKKKICDNPKVQFVDETRRLGGED